MDPRIEVSVWERIDAFDSASAASREKFSQFLINQRARRHGTSQPEVTEVERSTKLDTYSNLYEQARYTPSWIEQTVVLGPDGISGIGPEAVALFALFDSIVNGDLESEEAA